MGRGVNLEPISARLEAPPQLQPQRPRRRGRDIMQQRKPLHPRHRGQRDQVSVRAAWEERQVGPSGRSSALEPREPPFASARAPQAIDCQDHAARPAAGSSWQCMLLSFVITTSESPSSCSRKDCGLPEHLRCSACSSPTICKLHVGACWVRSGVGSMHSQHNTLRV